MKRGLIHFCGHVFMFKKQISAVVLGGPWKVYVGGIEVLFLMETMQMLGTSSKGPYMFVSQDLLGTLSMLKDLG